MQGQHRLGGQNNVHGILLHCFGIYKTRCTIMRTCTYTVLYTYIYSHYGIFTL